MMGRVLVKNSIFGVSIYRILDCTIDIAGSFNQESKNRSLSGDLALASHYATTYATNLRWAVSGAGFLGMPRAHVAPTVNCETARAFNKYGAFEHRATLGA